VAVLGKNIGGGPGPSSFGRHPRLSEITIEPISGVLLKNLGAYTLETWRRAASAESARIEAPRGVGFLGRDCPPAPAANRPTHSRHISGPRKPSSRNNALRSRPMVL